MKYTESYSDKISKLKNEIETADAIVIGAGAGLSTSAGLDYSGERFRKYFPDFIERYGFRDMYSGGFYPFSTPEEYWAYWSRYIYVNRFMDVDNGTYRRLYELVRDKDYFVITTNVDHKFQQAGFDKKRLFYMQGDYGLFQCSQPCCAETWDNKDIIVSMTDKQYDMKIPSELVPVCPHCSKPITTNLRVDDKFVQDEGWYKACERYEHFIRTRKNQHILFMELGVGYNTPAIIKYPFWQMTARNSGAVYACLNYGEAFCPQQIESQSVCIDGDIAEILKNITSK